MGFAAESRVTVAPSSTATGGSFCGVTVIETMPIAVSRPSLTVYVNPSGPL